MIKTFFFALLVSLARSQTNRVDPTNLSVPAGFGEHCTLAEPEYCHCAVAVLESNATEETWFRVDPRVHTCEQAAHKLHMVSWVFDVPCTGERVCDEQDDGQCVEGLDCDLAIRGFYMDRIPHTKKLQFPVVIVTQQDRSDLSLQVVYKNTNQVPSWVTFDQKHALFMVDFDGFMHDGQSSRALLLRASLGRCRATMDIRLGLKPADDGEEHASSMRWYDSRHHSVAIIWGIFICSWGVMLYTNHRLLRESWPTMSVRLKAKLVGALSALCVFHAMFNVYLSTYYYLEVMPSRGMHDEV